jgi:uncharacterized protein HemY
MLNQTLSHLAKNRIIIIIIAVLVVILSFWLLIFLLRKSRDLRFWQSWTMGRIGLWQSRTTARDLGFLLERSLPRTTAVRSA